jgi:hypothetical protein
MPKYLYRCAECDTISYFYHSMLEKKEYCAACQVSGTLIRLPSSFSLLSELGEKNKTGDLVKKSIEDFREELEIDKKEAKNEFFKPDE